VVLCTDEKSQVQARQIFSRRLMSDSHCPTVLGMLCVVLDDQLECREHTSKRIHQASAASRYKKLPSLWIAVDKPRPATVGSL
jgi:hypothetical protein